MPFGVNLSAPNPRRRTCHLHQSAELVEGPSPVWGEDGVRYYRSVRCAVGGELYAAVSGPPPYIAVEDVEPQPSSS